MCFLGRSKIGIVEIYKTQKRIEIHYYLNGFDTNPRIEIHHNFNGLKSVATI